MDNHSIILFSKGEGVRFPIIKAYNIPEDFELPKNATTIKISNLSLKKVVSGKVIIS